MKNRLAATLPFNLIIAMAAAPLLAAPSPHDRVYSADQNSNTISVIDPSTNNLLGQIRLGNPRPDILSPLYKGEINVHGLGFSPDHKTLIAVSNGSNSVAFIDTASNKVKAISYIGRSPHEGFFSNDGKEVWVTVRGADYISVIDAKTYQETRRIQTAPGPGMLLFHPDGKRAFVVHSFTPEVAVIDVASHKVIKRITVTSPFSPFLQLTPDGKELWMTHKDVGKVTRIDLDNLSVKEIFESGFISNHIAFAETDHGTLAYVTVGGENLVKVFNTESPPQLITSLKVGALPHGIWTSDDSSRIYVGLENGDAVEVINTANNRIIARIPVGQSPQALVYLSNAVPSGDGRTDLQPLSNSEPYNISLKAMSGEGRGFVVSRNLGLVDSLDVALFKLKPETVYSLYLAGQSSPIASFKTNLAGAANGNAIGPLRELVNSSSNREVIPATLLVKEGTNPQSDNKAVLSSTF